jgi:hypothetical protein
VVSFGLFLSFLSLAESVRRGAGTDYYRDIAAGAAILLEAGGLMTTANPPEDVDTAPIEDVRLGSRLYLAIRWVFELFPVCWIFLINIPDPLAPLPPRQAVKHKSGQFAKSGVESVTWNTRGPGHE